MRNMTNHVDVALGFKRRSLSTSILSLTDSKKPLWATLSAVPAKVAFIFDGELRKRDVVFCDQQRKTPGVADAM